jgi:hypothetical protein
MPIIPIDGDDGDSVKPVEKRGDERGGLSCVHCGNTDRTMITRWIEPANQITEERQEQIDQGTKYYCEQCGRTWVVQKLPFDGPTR